MTFFDSEIKQAKEKQIEAEQIVSDWHHAQVLCIEILELIEGALPLFRKLGADERVKSHILGTFIQYEIAHVDVPSSNCEWDFLKASDASQVRAISSDEAEAAYYRKRTSNFLSDDEEQEHQENKSQQVRAISSLDKAEHSFSDLTRDEVARLEPSPKLRQLLAKVRAIRTRFAKMFGFEEFECTPTFIKEYLQDIILSTPTLNLNVKSLERVGVNQFWHTVDVCLNACERHAAEQEHQENNLP